MIEEMKSDLTVLLKAGIQPIMWVVSAEETRTNDIVRELSADQKRPVYTWSCVQGLKFPGKDQPEEMSQDILVAIDLYVQAKDNTGGSDKDVSGILILYDAHPYVKEPAVIRRLKEASYQIQKSRKRIIIVAPSCDIPDELGFIPVIDQPLPDKKELERIVRDAYTCLPGFPESAGYTNRDAGIDELSTALQGLTINQARAILAQGAVRGKVSNELIYSEKKQLIRKTGLLEYFDTSDYSVDEIGGLDILKNEIRKYKKRFTSKALEYGLERPKGIILIGPPGTGKSLSVKAIGNELNIPLLKLSMSKISSKYYGETTQKIRAMCELAAAISPCILWIDEIEKALGTGVEAHEETMRAIAEFLTFMEETKSPIFFVGTCNDYRSLRPELMQRFERIFLVDLPNKREREEIFGIHLRKVKRDPKNFDLKKLVSESGGFVGREIRTMIKEGLSTAFYDSEREITTEDIVREFRRTQATSVQRASEINAMREWAKYNCTPASSDEPKEQKSEENNPFSGTEQ